MTHSQKVASYKAYLQTGDPQFIPSVYEKTAHVTEVQAWKDRWSKTAGCGLDHSNKKKKKKKGASYNKEARAGHPANVALARALSPGILPGLNPGGSKVHASHNGDFNHDIAAFMEEGVDPGTRAYLRGDKTAAPKQESLRQGRLRQGRLRQGRLRQGRLRQGYSPPQPTPTNVPPVPLPAAPPATLPQYPQSAGERTLPLPNMDDPGPPPTLPRPGGHELRHNPPKKKVPPAPRRSKIGASERPLSLSEMLRKFVAQQK